MSNRLLKGCIVAVTAVGVLCLAWLALDRGPTELMALATVLTAGATFVANVESKDK